MLTTTGVADQYWKILKNYIGVARTVGVSLFVWWCLKSDSQAGMAWGVSALQLPLGSFGKQGDVSKTQTCFYFIFNNLPLSISSKNIFKYVLITPD